MIACRQKAGFEEHLSKHEAEGGRIRHWPFIEKPLLWVFKSDQPLIRLKHLFWQQQYWVLSFRSKQKGPRRTAWVLSPLRLCWKIIWHHGAKWWLDGEGGKKAENDGSKKEKRHGGVAAGRRSIQHPCLYHVITCQSRFKNKAFEKPFQSYSTINTLEMLTQTSLACVMGVTLSTTRPSASLSHTPAA